MGTTVGVPVFLEVTALQGPHRLRGIGRYVKGLAEALLAQQDIPLQVLAWQAPLPFQVPPPHKLIQLAAPRLPQYRGRGLLTHLWMSRALHSLPQGIVHFTAPEAICPGRSGLTFATVYDLIPMVEVRRPRQVLANLDHTLQHRRLQRVDRYFAISNATAQDLISLLGIQPARISVVPPGGFPRKRPASSGPDLDSPYFLFVGGPNPNKNLALLLTAMELPSTPKLKLLIAGNWLPAQVATLSETLSADIRGRVVHLGYVSDDDLWHLMGRAVAVVVPSTHEGFGLPVAEAIAAGGCVIHSELAALLEASGGAAVTFSPSSAYELSHALARVAAEPGLRAQLIDAGRRNTDRLSWTRSARTTVTAYREGLAQLSSTYMAPSDS